MRILSSLYDSRDHPMEEKERFELSVELANDIPPWYLTTACSS